MPVEVYSPFCRLNVMQGCWQGLLLITKIGSSEDIYNGIDKIALPRCFVCNHRVPMCVANISAHFDEMVENYICTFT